jgi:hypothetical protein
MDAAARPVVEILGDILATLDTASFEGVAATNPHTLSDRQATVGMWIDGHEYSLTLHCED